jgi:hypothetical protein
MTQRNDDNENNSVGSDSPEVLLETSIKSVQSRTSSPNEDPVTLSVEGLAPHVRVVRASRPSLTYERME